MTDAERENVRKAKMYLARSVSVGESGGGPSTDIVQSSSTRRETAEALIEKCVELRRWTIAGFENACIDLSVMLYESF